MQVEKGNNVKVHYTGTLTDGQIFDSSEGGEPLEFTAGSGQMIDGFDAAVHGMSVGESKTIEIPCAQAYGEYDPELIIQVPVEDIPAELNPEVGMHLEMGSPDGESLPMLVTITEMTDTHITLDGNAPLAGKDLIFKIELIDIKR